MSADRHEDDGVGERLAVGTAEPSGTGPAPRTGTRSLLLGLGAVAMGACPWLPEAVSPWIRFFPVYLIVPVGIWAIASGVGVLRTAGAVGGPGPAARRRAWGGTVLGTMAVLVPVGAAIWAFVVLSTMNA
ncbi:hypothetical protein ABZX98_24805 [Streptomyces sp. NPDC002992]|uniref:hypothetical protein n=1 Tax=Streptomyces sp. NPDC002992 TaxID=3154273 RepID=UPI0033A65230